MLVLNELAWTDDWFNGQMKLHVCAFFTPPRPLVVRFNCPLSPHLSTIFSDVPRRFYPAFSRYRRAKLSALPAVRSTAIRAGHCGSLRSRGKAVRRAKQSALPAVRSTAIFREQRLLAEPWQSRLLCPPIINS